jgi:putative ABC transport system permease protein
MRMVVAGLAAGLIVALLLAKLLSAFLFGVPSTDPFTFAAAVLLMLSTALAACLVPAVRASRVDPIQTLRSE